MANFWQGHKALQSEEAYNWGRWFIYLDLLNELVAKGVTYEVHEYTPMFPLRSGTPDLTDLTAAASSGSTAHNQWVHVNTLPAIVKSPIGITNTLRPQN